MDEQEIDNLPLSKGTSGFKQKCTQLHFWDSFSCSFTNGVVHFAPTFFDHFCITNLIHNACKPKNQKQTLSSLQIVAQNYLARYALRSCYIDFANNFHRNLTFSTWNGVLKKLPKFITLYYLLKCACLKWYIFAMLANYLFCGGCGMMEEKLPFNNSFWDCIFAKNPA